MNKAKKHNNFTYYFGTASDNIHLEVLRTHYAAYTFHHPAIADAAIHIGTESIALSTQIHSISGQYVATPPHPFTGYGDYLITNCSSTGLAILTADCLPIIVYEAISNCIVLIHAGWRGSVGGIVTQVIIHLQRISRAPLIIDVIFGPHARSCCYAIGSNVAHTAEKIAPHAIITRDNILFLDLLILNYAQLIEHGINLRTICYDNAICTVCNTNYYSYRRQQENAGRNITLVRLHR